MGATGSGPGGYSPCCAATGKNSHLNRWLPRSRVDVMLASSFHTGAAFTGVEHGPRAVPSQVETTGHRRSREPRIGEQDGRNARGLPTVHGAMLPGTCLSCIADGKPDVGRPSEAFAAAVVPFGVRRPRATPLANDAQLRSNSPMRKPDEDAFRDSVKPREATRSGFYDRRSAHGEAERCSDGACERRSGRASRSAWCWSARR